MFNYIERNMLMTTPNITSETLMKAKEVVAEFGFATETTLARWRMENRELPFLRCAGNIRYKRQDVLDWLERQRQEVSS